MLLSEANADTKYQGCKTVFGLSKKKSNAGLGLSLLALISREAFAVPCQCHYQQALKPALRAAAFLENVAAFLTTLGLLELSSFQANMAFTNLDSLWKHMHIR